MDDYCDGRVELRSGAIVKIPEYRARVVGSTELRSSRESQTDDSDFGPLFICPRVLS